ncbi:DUF3667 domain-containing protein [Aegicerativicinus sediminis]
MSEEYMICKNCEQEIEKDFEFCPYCGQKTKDELTLKLLFYNTITNYFSFDARFLKSFIPLMFKPGYLAKKFLQGKRLLYLHPAQMYLFISVIFFFLFSFIQREQVQNLNEGMKNVKIPEKAKIDSAALKVLDTIDVSLTELSKKTKIKGVDSLKLKELDSLIIRPKEEGFLNNFNLMGFKIRGKEIDSLIELEVPDSLILKHIGLKKEDGMLKRKFASQMLKFYRNKDAGNILQTFYDTIPIAMFFLLPIFSLIVMVFYFNKGRFTHHLVFSFYYFSFLFTVFSLDLIANFIIDLPGWIDFLIAASTFVYLVLALRRFYEQGRFLSFFKGSLIAFFFLIFVVPLAAGFVITYAFLFY